MGIAITRIEALHLRHAAGLIKDYVVRYELFVFCLENYFVYWEIHVLFIILTHSEFT